MNRYLKSFLYRGLIFAGFGPIILGIVFFFIDISGVDLTIEGTEILLAIISTYILAFVHAGASVFNQIEHWPLAKSLGCHFSSLFTVYTLTYILNSWIPFEPVALLVFSLIFATVYFTVWLTVYVSNKVYTRKLNAKIKEN